MAESSLVYEISGSVMNYDWGDKGKNSLVATFKSIQDNSFVVLDNVPYAELWFGCHTKAPSDIIINSTKIPLPDFLSKCMVKKFPYLLKILSINAPLSIQVHPNKKDAKDLHLRSPQIYPDDNHKPEIAIALSKFCAMIGIRPLKEITNYLESIPSLLKLIDPIDFKNLKSEYTARITVKNIVSTIISAPKNVIISIFDEIIGSQLTDLALLLNSIHSQHPYDAGGLFIYLMNIVYLDVGESIYIGPNVPHAYIYGNIIECMANSDNVIRLGLTTKHIDIDTMLRLTDFGPRDSSSFFPKLEVSIKNEIKKIEYVTDFEEFTIFSLSTNSQRSIGHDIKVKKLSVIIIISGVWDLCIIGEDKTESCVLSQGKAYFFAYNVTLRFRSIDARTNIMAYVAEPKSIDNL